MKAKKIFSIILSLVMIFTSLSMTSISSFATSKTASEAVNWANSQVGKSLDYDGVYGAQCVDLTKYYYSFLGVSPVNGHGCDYATNSLPSGWQRIKYYSGFVPQPGDIAVWTYTTSSYGHVAIITSANSSTMYVVEQNGSTHVTRSWSYNYSYGTFYGVIRPNFSGSSTTPSTSYSSITQGDYYIENGNGMILTTPYNDNTSGNIVNAWDFYAHPGYRVNITGSAAAYKLRFCNCADNIAINAYSNSPTAGTIVNIREYTNNSTQWWVFDHVGNGWYVIRNVYNPNVCLTLTPDSAGHGDVTLQTYTGSINQKWALHPYVSGTVSYNANGGSGAPSSQTKHYRENLTLSSTYPTRSGYTFQGWSTTSSATVATYAAGGTYTSESSATLYAVWKANTYTISYNANGGSGAPSSQTKTHGQTLTLRSTTPTRSGYTFLGWSTSSSATSASYQPGGSFTTNANTTLYAVWRANASTYTVSYNANGGSGAPASQTKTQGQTLTLSSTIPTRSGYNFLGWSTSSNATTATYRAGGSYTANASVTLYAVWEIQSLFPDVRANEWYYDAVKFNVQKGYFRGYENGYFGPADNIQRQDFVVVLANVAGANLNSYRNSNGGFSDVPKNSYYAAAIAWAVDNDIVTGYGGTTLFGVGDPITREQACAIIYRYVVTYCGGSGSMSNTTTRILSSYSDKNSVSDWAKTNVAWAIDKGVIKGTTSTTISPLGNANRAQIAQIIMNMSNNGLI